MSSEIVSLVEANPTLVLIDEKKFEDFYEHVKAEAKAAPVDLTTEKGRKAVASMAFKIARTKTAIDDAGKKLNEDARAKINAVDASRRTIWDRFEALQREVRQPLTDWEKAETERVGKVQRFFDRMKEYSKVALDDTAETVKTRYENLSLIHLDEAVFNDRHDEAIEALDSAMSTLKSAYERLQQEEADRAELARLRAEAEERARLEAERKAEEQRKAHEAEEQRQREEARKQEEERQKAEQERIEREARERAEAEARAKVAAAEKAAREAEEAANRKIEEERQAREREKAEREQREADAKAAEEARQADREHRGKIMGAAKAAIIEIGVAEQIAKEIVLAIAAGNVPNVSIRF